MIYMIPNIANIMFTGSRDVAYYLKNMTQQNLRIEKFVPPIFPGVNKPFKSLIKVSNNLL